MEPLTTEDLIGKEVRYLEECGSSPGSKLARVTHIELHKGGTARIGITFPCSLSPIFVRAETLRLMNGQGIIYLAPKEIIDQIKPDYSNYFLYLGHHKQWREYS